MERSLLIHGFKQQNLATWLTMFVVAFVVCGQHSADGQNDSSKYVYKISTGEIRLGNEVVGKGYSGKKGTCRNNPNCTGEKNKGPIPVGLYSIGQSYNSQKVGPLALPLTPIGGQDMFGRSAFLIHGDNAAQDASEGCIILARDIRQRISNGQVKKLEVV